MTAYLLTSVGVIFLTIIISFIVPEGKLKKSVTLVLRLVCIAVLIQPVTKLFTFSNKTTEYKYDYEYVCQVYSQNQSNLLTNKIKNDLGVDCVCVVEVVYEDNKIKENGVTVNTNFDESVTLCKIAEYLSGLGYINITVNEEVFRIPETT